MRTIKFRAKALDKKIEGWAVSSSIVQRFDGKGNPHVFFPTIGWEIEIDPETLGEFTGYKDKNGKEIYEGDIIRVERELSVADLYEVIYSFDNDPFTMLNLEGKYCANGNFDCEIVGNMTDNPNMMGDYHDFLAEEGGDE